VKSRLASASIAWLLLLAACGFDRSPLLRKHTTQGSTRADSGAASDGGTLDGSQLEMDAGFTHDTGAITSGDAGSVDGAADAPTDAAHPLDEADAAMPIDTTHPNDPPPIPSTGGLECGGTACAFAPQPTHQCCTTQSDVAHRSARHAERCGLDLSALPSYGDGCWQRDQLGSVNELCPSVEAEPGVSPEPGCCTDDGQCGTINASQKLGCRHPVGSEMGACSDTPMNTSCDPTGTFGIRVSVDAAWGGRSGGLVGLTDDGRGTIQVYLAVSFDSVDPRTHELNAKGRVCGFSLPAFYSTTLCEAYLPEFPNSVWESSAVPKLALSGRYDCSNSGCALSLNPLTYLLGFEMANPEAPWPSSAQTSTLQCPSGRQAACFPDQDRDGRPGVQLALATSGAAPSKPNACLVTGFNYRGAPVSASVAAIFDGVRRANRLQLGSRMKVGGSFRLSDDCMTAHGSAVAEYVNSRAYGCLIQPGTYDFPVGTRAGANDACSSTEAQFMDANLPVYEVLAAGTTPPKALNLSDKSASRGPESSVVRLGAANAAVSCAVVRAAKY
jgi:hypothetical protein